jgi:hypothetical protein
MRSKGRVVEWLWIIFCGALFCLGAAGLIYGVGVAVFG